jgi:hypothetical protein
LLTLALDFLYSGHVIVPEDQLTSFMAVAEKLEINSLSLNACNASDRQSIASNYSTVRGSSPSGLTSASSSRPPSSASDGHQARPASKQPKKQACSNVTKPVVNGVRRHRRNDEPPGLSVSKKMKTESSFEVLQQDALESEPDELLAAVDGEYELADADLETDCCVELMEEEEDGAVVNGEDGSADDLGLNVVGEVYENGGDLLPNVPDGVRTDVSLFYNSNG